MVIWKHNFDLPQLNDLVDWIFMEGMQVEHSNIQVSKVWLSILEFANNLQNINLCIENTRPLIQLLKNGLPI